MGENDLHNLLKQLASPAKVPADVWRALLSELNAGQRTQLAHFARDVAKGHFGNGVYVRALIEISSYCRNNCNYCGLRCSNKTAQRYRLTKEEILECCCQAAELGFNTFVLQGGEDLQQSPVDPGLFAFDIDGMNEKFITIFSKFIKSFFICSKIACI